MKFYKVISIYKQKIKNILYQINWIIITFILKILQINIIVFKYKELMKNIYKFNKENKYKIIYLQFLIKKLFSNMINFKNLLQKKIK